MRLQFLDNPIRIKTRLPMYITKTQFSFQNRFSVYLCNVKWFLIASKQLRNVRKHLPTHKISFSNLFLSFSNDFLYEIHLKFPQITDFEQEILTERWKWYQISEIHVRFSKIQIRSSKYRSNPPNWPNLYSQLLLSSENERFDEKKNICKYFFFSWYT